MPSCQAFLLDKNPTRISDHGLAHFAVDVRFMTALSAALPGDVGEVFSELSQVRWQLPCSPAPENV